VAFAISPRALTAQLAGASYIPVPSSASPTFSGLFTIDLPPTVRKGQEFNVTVTQFRPKILGSIAFPDVRPRVRRAVGSFNVQIPVSTAPTLLPYEQDTLAILKARFAALSLSSPQNPWVPVLGRYIGYIGARVDGFGGDASIVPASFSGAPWSVINPSHGDDNLGETCYTGKVIGLIYDNFGDFDGFLLALEQKVRIGLGGDTESGEDSDQRRHRHRHRTRRELREKRFKSREGRIAGLVYVAWEKRQLISVYVDAGDSGVRAIVLRESRFP
jgi:hypothetical protein